MTHGRLVGLSGLRTVLGSLITRNPTLAILKPKSSTSNLKYLDTGNCPCSMPDNLNRLWAFALSPHDDVNMGSIYLWKNDSCTNVTSLPESNKAGKDCSPNCNDTCGQVPTAC